MSTRSRAPAIYKRPLLAATALLLGSAALVLSAAAMSQDGRFVAHVHAPPELLDVVDEDWRHETLAHDDFDLPHEDDSDTDEARSAPKRKVEEKWTELCLDDFTNPNGGRRGQPPRA